MSRFILGMPTFREPYNPLQQGEEQPAVPPDRFFLYYAICWYLLGEKENCEGGGREEREIGQSSIFGRINKEKISIFYLCCNHYLYLNC